MKNKVLAALLSVCLFAGLAVPAFAYVDVNNSALRADAADGKVIKTTETAIELTNGDTGKDLLNYVSFLVDDTLAADPSELIWDLEDKEGAFVNNGQHYSAIADKGTGYAIISTPDGKAELKIKLTAKAAAKTRYATGFKFEKTKYELVGGTGAAAATDIVIVATPAGSEFAPLQVTELDKIKAHWSTGGQFVTAGGVVISATGAVSGGKYTMKTDPTITAALTIDTATWSTALSGTPAGGSITQTAVAGTKINNDNKVTVSLTAFPTSATAATTAARSATTTFKFVAPKNAVDIRNNGTLVINVGQEIDLESWVKLIPTTANNVKNLNPSTDNKWSFSYDYYNENDDIEYVAVSGNTIRGVKVGKLKVTATHSDTNLNQKPDGTPDPKSTTFVVDVRPFAGAAAKGDEDTPLVAPQRTLKVGQTFTVAFGSAVTAEEAAAATYGSLHEDIATVSDKGVVTAVKAGEAKVWVQVDGYAKGYYTVTVTDGSSTNVPQTAVVALAPLF